jgi:MinD-like ATPase involved in chromosome partitioning or flagellar assembly
LLGESIECRAIVILVEDDADAESLARMLDDLRAENASVVVRLPPVRGIRFFADGSAQRQLDAWWDAQIPPGALPILVADHRDELVEWLYGLDGRSYVGVTSAAAAARYDGCAGVRVVMARSALDYAAAVMGDLVEDGIYADIEVDRVRALAAPFPQAPVDNTQRLASPAVDLSDGQDPDPFDLLIAMSLDQAETTVVATSSTTSSALDPIVVERRGMRLPGWVRRSGYRGGHSDHADRHLADALIRHGSTIVAVGSRKGGVGKTSHAAGVAIVAGAALDLVGRCAAIVDANLANPDAWGQLNLPAGAATVRDMIAALATNGEPPRPVHASTPALACYPESREASEYSRTEIGLLAGHLRSRYPLVIVDLSNRLPDPTGGAEAAAAAYWLEHADVLVLPSAASKQDFNGVLDYLDVRDIPPAIVASLASRTRRNREHPLAKRYMNAIAQRAYRVVEIPDEAERVRYAGMQGVPVETVSSALKAAYRELAEAIAAAPRPVTP